MGLLRGLRPRADLGPCSQTVKYFGGEEHEAARYREAIKEYQALEFKVMGMPIDHNPEISTCID